MPMVATRTTTRGDLRNRRITVASTMAPSARPITNATARATQKGTWYCTTSNERSVAPMTPMLPTAKLMIREAR